MLNRTIFERKTPLSLGEFDTGHSDSMVKWIGILLSDKTPRAFKLGLSTLIATLPTTGVFILSADEMEDILQRA